MSREVWHIGERKPEPGVSMSETEDPTDQKKEPSLVGVTSGWYTEVA
jgi:hypothetical protein